MTVIEFGKYNKCVSDVCSADRPFIMMIKVAVSSSGLIDDADLEKAKEAAKKAVADVLGAKIVPENVALKGR